MEDSEEELRTLAHRAAATGDIDVLTKAIRGDPTILEQQDAEGKACKQDLIFYTITYC